ncbi:hypothetical protein TNCV_1133591 [Trichonephila clavipes]|nr:hypothetical protein TNCV_1133591 [Trichonephila clavipes]
MFIDKPEAIFIQRESVHKISRKITDRYFTSKTTGTFLTITSQTSGTYQLVALTVLRDKFFQQYLGVLPECSQEVPSPNQDDCICKGALNDGHNHTGPAPSVMVWGGRGLKSRTSTPTSTGFDPIPSWLCAAIPCTQYSSPNR